MQPPKFFWEQMLYSYTEFDNRVLGRTFVNVTVEVTGGYRKFRNKELQIVQLSPILLLRWSNRGKWEAGYYTTASNTLI